MPAGASRDYYESVAAPRTQKPAQTSNQKQTARAATQDEEDLRETFRRADEIFRSVSAPAHGDPQNDGTGAAGMCSVCRRRKSNALGGGRGEHHSAPPKMERGWERNQQQQEEHDGDDEEEGQEETYRRQTEEREVRDGHQQRQQEAKEKRMDPQAALGRVLNDLEADFELHKR